MSAGKRTVCKYKINICAEQKRVYVHDMAALTVLSVHHSIKIENDHTHASAQQLFNEARCSDTSETSDYVFCDASASELHLVGIAETRSFGISLLQDLVFERGRGISDLCALFSFWHCLVASAPIDCITISIKACAREGHECMNRPRQSRNTARCREDVVR